MFKCNSRRRYDVGKTRRTYTKRSIRTYEFALKSAEAEAEAEAAAAAAAADDDDDDDDLSS